MLASTRTVIVDEIHAIAAGKRGSHLALSLERLQGLCAEPLTRIGLSATQKPIEAVARFLVGTERDCAIVDIGHARPRDLAIEVPLVPLSAVMANDVWELVYDRLAQLAREHRTTLVFVNTRRLAERLARHLSERLGKTAVAAHHGSLAKEMRLDAEQRLKAGELQVLIATASWSWGLISAKWTWCARSAHPVPSTASCNGSAVQGTRSVARPRGACLPPPATT